MTYGTKQYKNGKVSGYLIFDTGKKIFLNKKEVIDFQNKINYWQEIALDTKGDMQIVKII